MVEFRKITQDNLREIAALAVAEHQGRFIAPNAMSIMEAYVAITNGGVALPFGIYDGDRAVGFIMFTYGAKKDEGMPEVAYHNYCIWRLMIDARYQGQGYGRQAMREALRYMRSAPCGPGQRCWLCHHPENAAAKAFYEKCGFTETGELFDGEAIAVRDL